MHDNRQQFIVQSALEYVAAIRRYTLLSYGSVLLFNTLSSNRSCASPRAVFALAA